MAFNISYNFEAIDNFTRVSKKIEKSVQAVGNKVTRLDQKLKKAGKSLGDLGKKMALRVTAPLVAFGTFAIKAASNIEDMSIAFEGMLHSASKAKVVVEDLVEFAARTPFHLEDVSGAAQQLIEFGFTTDQTMATLKQLGDISALTHTPLSNLAQVFGRVSLRGKATARELMSLTNMRVPLVKTLKDMAKHAGHANVDVYALAATGAITAKVFNAAFKKMTTGTGIFANAAEKYSESLSGRLSTLHDAIKFVLTPIGDMIISSFDLTNNIHKLSLYLVEVGKRLKVFAKAHKQLAKIIIISVAIFAALAPIIIALGAIVFLAGLIASPIYAVVAVVLAVVAVVTYLFFKFQLVHDVIMLVWDALGLVFNIMRFIFSIFEKMVVWSLKLAWVFAKPVFSAIKAIGNFLDTMVIKPLLFIIHALKKITSHKAAMDVKTTQLHQYTPLPQQQTFSPIPSTQQRVRSDVNISLHDPGGLISRVGGKNDGGALGFNLGANMATSG